MTYHTEASKHCMDDVRLFNSSNCQPQICVHLYQEKTFMIFFLVMSGKRRLV